MERKIGEIFEFGGDWYQCVKSPDGSCKHCDMNFSGKCPIPIKECVASSRSDLSYVIFKKLEKVGEPYYSSYYKQVLQEYKYYTSPIISDTKVHILKLGIVRIEIKQNKEDMEENRTINQQFTECEQTINDVVRKCYTENKSTQIKDMEEKYKAENTPLTRLVGRYVNNLIDYDVFEKAVKELYTDKEESKPNLKPFDLDAAKAGKAVCTRDGRKARIICFDAKCADTPIVALVSHKNEEESLLRYYRNGKFRNDEDSDADLMMLPEKKEGWVNIDKGGSGKITISSPYSTKEEAIHNDNETTIDTIKISWEE